MHRGFCGWRALLAAVAITFGAGGALAQENPAQLGRGVIDDARGYSPQHHPIRGIGGLVVSQSRLASEVGAEILRKGGNAIDAAVAVGLSEAVTLPRAGNLAGGGYMLVYLAAEKRTVAIDYYFQGPAALTPEFWNDAQGKVDRRNATSYKGVAIPGTIAGFYKVHRSYGKLSWHAVVQPAIDLALDGVALSDDEAMILKWGRRTLEKDPVAKRIFYKKDGSAYEAGERLKQPELAWSLKQIRDQGADAFYKGELAKRLVAGIHQGGGLITLEDLANYEAREFEPLWSTYRGVKLALVPPSASGVTLAEILNILESFPLEEYGAGSSLSTHLIAEATRIAVADRGAHLGGVPYRTPASGLISKSFAKERAALIKLDRAIPADQLGGSDPFAHESKDTTHYTVADTEGNVVSNTYTLVANFGAGVVPAGTGILLNNALTNFNWDDVKSVSAPAGSKRVTSTITPFIAFKDEQPWLAAGTPGGGFIISALAQFLVNVIDYKLNIAEATSRPRINATPDGVISYEQSFAPDVIRLLEAKGHRTVPSISQTSIQSIELRDGKLYGSPDPRRPDSAAVGVVSPR